MSALFRLDGIILLLLLAICTACKLKQSIPSWFNANSESRWRVTLWKLARIGERLSPWIAISLVVMAIRRLFF
jgi:hypothetical protein